MVIAKQKKPIPSPKDILTCKLCIWSHEEEYRAFTEREDGKAKLGGITGVIFGVRAEPSFKEQIESMLQIGVTVYDAKINFDRNYVQRVKRK